MEEKVKKKQIKGNNREQLLDCLAFVALCLFVISPLIQIVREIIAPHKVTVFGPIHTYPDTILKINYVTAIATVIIGLKLILQTLQGLREGKRPRVFWPLAIFFGLTCWMYLSQTINGFTEYAYVGESYRNESLFTFILYLLGYFFLGTVLKSDRFRRMIVIVFFASNFIVGTLVLIDRYASKLEYFADRDGMAAIFFQFNHYGYYLLFGILISAILFVVGRNRMLRVFCAIVYVLENIILILNNTFGCYLAVIAALIFATIVIALSRRNRGEILRMLAMLFVFVAITAIMRGLNYGNGSDVSQLVSDLGNITSDNDKAAYAGTGRWALWKHTMEYISERPVFGWGVEGITDRLGSEIDVINNRPHNEYLQWAAFFGIPGAILYIAALCVVMFGMFPRIKKADSISIACFIASAGYIASAFVGNTMYYTAPFFFIFLGMMCRDRFYEKDAAGTDRATDVVEKLESK